MEPGNSYKNILKPFYVYAQESKRDFLLMNEIKKQLKWLILPEHEKALTTFNPKRQEDELKKIAERIWQEIDIMLFPHYIQAAKNQLDEKQYDQAHLTCQHIRSQVYNNRPILYEKHYSEFYKQMGEIYYELEDFKFALLRKKSETVGTFFTAMSHLWCTMKEKMNHKKRLYTPYLDKVSKTLKI